MLAGRTSPSWFVRKLFPDFSHKSLGRWSPSQHLLLLQLLCHISVSHASNFVFLVILYSQLCLISFVVVWPCGDGFLAHSLLSSEGNLSTISKGRPAKNHQLIWLCLLCFNLNISIFQIISRNTYFCLSLYKSHVSMPSAVWQGQQTRPSLDWCRLYVLVLKQLSSGFFVGISRWSPHQEFVSPYSKTPDLLW